MAKEYKNKSFFKTLSLKAPTKRELLLKDVI